MFFDGSEVTFGSSEETDAWIITINYSHSTHTIVMALSSNQAENQPQTTAQWVVIGASVAIIAIVAGTIVVVLNKKRQKRNI